MQYENTYFQMQETNKAYQKAQRGPRPTEEQLARIARENAPQPVSPSEVNPASGKINWPSVLQEDGFAAGRAALEQLSAKKAAHGSLSISGPNGRPQDDRIHVRGVEVANQRRSTARLH